jgi:hypothetical protein
MPSSWNDALWLYFYGYICLVYFVSLYETRPNAEFRISYQKSAFLTRTKNYFSGKMTQKYCVLGTAHDELILLSS